jgi:5-methylcytosine-specific restriction protein A
MAWSKESRHSRGYGTEWNRLRKQILERDNYLCQCDNCKGGVKRTTPATEVDHITSKAQAKLLRWTKAQIDSPDNLNAINKDCHKAKTIQEQGKQYKEKVAIGIDGWPK